MIWKILILIYLAISFIACILIKSIYDKVTDIATNKYPDYGTNSLDVALSSFKLYLTCLIPILNLGYIFLVVFHRKELIASALENIDWLVTINSIHNLDDLI